MTSKHRSEPDFAFEAFRNVASLFFNETFAGYDKLVMNIMEALRLPFPSDGSGRQIAEHILTHSAGKTYTAATITAAVCIALDHAWQMEAEITKVLVFPFIVWRRLSLPVDQLGTSRSEVMEAYSSGQIQWSLDDENFLAAIEIDEEDSPRRNRHRTRPRAKSPSDSRNLNKYGRHSAVNTAFATAFQ
jgi:hypothetical protein